MSDPSAINQKDSFTGYHTKQSLFSYLNSKFSGTLANLDLTILMIDLDRFKDINDKHGHLVGDEALKHFVKVLNTVLNGQHFVARYGGDEFVVVIDGSNKKDGAKESHGITLAHQITAKLKASKFNFPKNSMTLRCSIGIARFPHDAKDTMGVVDAADQALYYVKKHGRGGIAVFSQLSSFSSREKYIRLGRLAFVGFLAVVLGFFVYRNFDQAFDGGKKLLRGTQKNFSRYVLGRITRLHGKKYDDYVILKNDLELNGKVLHEYPEALIFTFDPWEKTWEESQGAINYNTLLDVPSKQIVYIHREVYPVNKHILVVIELKDNLSIKGWVAKEDQDGVYLSLEKLPDDFVLSSQRVVSYMMPLKIPLRDIKNKFKL